MNLIVDIPMPVRLAGLFVLGTCLGSLANLGVYRLAWHPRSISPWWPPDPKAPPRRWTDRVPIVGWLGLRREAGVHGGGFWIRPFLLELLAGVGFAALYWWEIDRAGLLLPNLPRPLAPGLLAILHGHYAVHLVLISLMIVASMIDIDEKIIPDTITVPGTLLGLLLAAAFPWSMLPDLLDPIVAIIPPAFWQRVTPDTWPLFLRLTSPISHNVWPGWLNGFPHGWSLVTALGCWWLWCVALMPRSWYPRHGWRRAVQLSVARLIRESATYILLLMGLIGSAAIAGVWFCGGTAWTGLLSALVGMAASGGLVWIVRIIGTVTLRREAMGFGDVTLMAMIGAFLGWQTCLIIFFLAPLAALGFAVLRMIFLRDREIPYGPFLCLATLAAIVGWATIWDQTWHAFALGWFVPLVMLICLALMAVMLGLYEWVRGLFG